MDIRGEMCYVGFIGNLTTFQAVKEFEIKKTVNILQS